MAQRVLKIILPPDAKEQAVKMLEAESNTVFWQEESSEGNFVISALAEAEHSEIIMDLFESRYSPVEGFRLIVFPVEAAIPRTDVAKKNETSKKPEDDDTKKLTILRISREELYSDIVDSTKLSTTFVLMVSSFSLLSSLRSRYLIRTWSLSIATIRLLAIATRCV